MEKFAIVTGGAKGIGKAISTRLGEEGWNLSIWGREESALKTVANDLKSKHRIQITTKAFDLATPSAIQKAFNELQKEGPLPQAMVANAGNYGELGRLDEVDIEAWKKSFNLNVFAIAELVHTFLRLRKPETKPRQKIVLMSGGGLGGSKIWPGASAYSCAKATLYRLVEVVHAENFERGVDINCIAPGAVRTGMTDQALKHGESRLGPLYQEALGVEKSGGESPELAASIIATLLSPVGDGVSGRLLSAKWDRKHLASDENAKRVIEDQDLLRLRRIDDELFARVPRKV